MGETNRVPARATGTALETPFGTLPHRGPAGEATLCLRPEAIGPAPGGLALGPARVRDAAFFGTHCRVHVLPDAAPGLTLIAHLPPGELPAPGDLLHLNAATDPLTVFAME
nr:TOBE domain-containing protein [Meridianimarinicoccus roseus]